MSPRERIIRARTALVLDEPFFGVLALRLKLVEDPSCKTMWTDGVALGYNPKWVETITDLEVKGVLCHEVLHNAAGHPWRRGARNPETWNEAADYAINPIVEDAGFLLPEGGLLDKAFKGLPAEIIYSRIKKPDMPPQPDSQPQPNPNGDSQDSGTGQSGDEGDEDSQDQDGSGQDDKSQSGKSKSGKGQPSDDKDDGNGDGQGNGEGDAESDADPQDGDGNGKGGKQKDEKPSPAGEVRDAPKGVNPKELEQEWKLATEQAANAARACGKLPGSLEAFANEVKKEVIDWKEVLWQFVQQSFLSPDYNWKLPNRRYMGMGLYMPALIGEQMPPVVVARDTSGSMPERLLVQIYAELKAIVDQMKPEMTYAIDADAAIQQVVEIYPGDEFQFNAKGRGGTDFRPVFQWVEDNAIQPCCLIYLTDMEGPAPATPPDYPVLWITPPRAPDAPFGIKIEMPLPQD